MITKLYCKFNKTEMYRLYLTEKTEHIQWGEPFIVDDHIEKGAINFQPQTQ